MLLSDRDITAAHDAGRLGCEPWDAALQPSSVDVRLDRFFRVFNNTAYTHIDPSTQQDDLTSLVEPADGRPFVLHPGEFVLGSTLEVVTLADDLAGRLEGKSSLGRLGLLTHSTAGFIDPGFSGHITLELSNVANLPIVLWPGMKIVSSACSSSRARRNARTAQGRRAAATWASAARPRAAAIRTGRSGGMADLRPGGAKSLRRPGWSDRERFVAAV